MNEILDILSGLRARGIELFLDEEGRNIRARGNIKSLSSSEKEWLAGRKEEIILLLKQSRQALMPIDPLPTGEDYPLSSPQRRLWILSRFEEANIAYNMPGAYVFEGRLHYKALEDSFALLLQRHESLRTVFRENSSGEIRQVIRPLEDFHFTLNRVDLRGRENREQLLKDLMLKESRAPFDLAAGPLLRASIYEMEEGKWVFSFVMHHITGDGWSMGVLVKELLSFYRSFSAGAQPVHQPLRIQYKDYAAWLQERLGGEKLQPHRQYWLDQFKGELPVLDLPYDMQRAALKTYSGATLIRSIDANTGNALRSLARTQEATLFMTLLAAVNTLLYRYSGQEDMIIGTPIAGREHTELEDQIGCYINTLALRSRFNGEEDFLRLLQQVRNTTLEAYEHQVYPFDELIDELRPARDLSRSTLFDVMAVLQNAHALIGESSAGDLRVSAYAENEDGASKFDLVFDFAEAGESINLHIQYNTDLFNANTMERLAAHFLQLLRSITQAPATPLHQLNILSEQEKQVLLFTFNNTAADYLKEKTIISLFEEQVQADPYATALSFEGGTLTYAQLDEGANKLAHYLRSGYAIRPGELITVCLQRSPELVISILAIIKAGGAYVPIDPSYPEERIDYIREDSRSKVLIDKSEMEKFLSVQHGYPGETPAPEGLTSSSLAYVIYTSGSTGKPKGVMVQHGALVNFSSWCRQAFDIRQDDRSTLYAGVAFDASVLELFPFLICGASIHIIPEDIRLDIERLAEYYEANRITTCYLPTLIGEQFAAYGAEPSSLRKLVVGGQKLGSFTKRKYDFINAYGPTESTVIASIHTVTEPALNIPVGKPVANTQFYILDKYLNLQPQGVVGEICISGESLALGYWGQPGLTAEKFIAHPFKNGERIYRTGDLGRWLEDGSIEFLGRKDEQVKIRGYRIELGEIESALQSHASITSCAVLAKEARQGETELVAYITAEQMLGVEELRTWLGKTLPGYMVPAHFVQMEALPLTPNGKVDRRQLPAPEGLALSAATVYEAPRNDTEEKLVAIWEGILGRSRIGINDNFFELGGNSLKIIRMVEAVNTAFGKNLPVVTGFRYPKIERLAQLLLEEQQAAADIKSDEDFDRAVDTIEDTLLIINRADHED